MLNKDGNISVASRGIWGLSITIKTITFQDDKLEGL